MSFLSSVPRQLPPQSAKRVIGRVRPGTYIDGRNSCAVGAPPSMKMGFSRLIERVKIAHQEFPGNGRKLIKVGETHEPPDGAISYEVNLG
jgi:hypothetical protein